MSIKKLCLTLIALLVLALSACRPPYDPSIELTPTSAPAPVLLETVTPALESPLISPLQSPLQSPLPTPAAQNQPIPGNAADLVILHTNDTWGYHIPCG